MILLILIFGWYNFGFALFFCVRFSIFSSMTSALKLFYICGFVMHLVSFLKKQSLYNFECQKTPSKKTPYQKKHHKKPRQKKFPSKKPSKKPPSKKPPLKKYHEISTNFPDRRQCKIQNTYCLNMYFSVMV